MSRTISSGHASGITLTNTADNSVIITPSGIITKDAGSQAALSATSGHSWTIDNASLISTTNADGGVGLFTGSLCSAVTNAVITNELGGAAVNDGTVQGGSSGAILLGTNVANRVVVDPGAVFIGKIACCCGTRKLGVRDGSAASVGTLNSAGITNFTTSQFDADTSSTVTGNTTAAARAAGTLSAGRGTNQCGCTIRGVGVVYGTSFVLTVTNAGSIAR